MAGGGPGRPRAVKSARSTGHSRPAASAPRAGNSNTGRGPRVSDASEDEDDDDDDGQSQVPARLPASTAGKTTRKITALTGRGGTLARHRQVAILSKC